MAFRLTCPYCQTNSIMRVKSVHMKTYDDINLRPYCLLVCDNCQNGSLLSFHINSGYAHELDDFPEDDVVYGPSVLRECRFLPKTELSVPKHLPAILDETYKDAEFNFSSKRWKAAAQLYLQALEFACVSATAGADEVEAEAESAKKVDLTRRINSLFDSGTLTQPMKEWAHQIRVIGQYHKHRYVEANQTETAELRAFCDMFMQYLYTMPGMLKARRERLKSQEE